MDELMNFGEALIQLKEGEKVTRRGWNGKNMWLIHVPGQVDVKVLPDSPYHRAGLRVVSIGGHIDMMTVQGIMQPGWLTSQADMLADDWEIFE